MSFPILVERYRGDQSMTIVCESCGATLVIGENDILNDGVYACPDLCGGRATYMFEEADRCPNCRTLGFYEEVLDYCCSRVCQLQAEYARELSHSASTREGSTR